MSFDVRGLCFGVTRRCHRGMRATIRSIRTRASPEGSCRCRGRAASTTKTNGGHIGTLRFTDLDANGAKRLRRSVASHRGLSGEYCDRNRNDGSTHFRSPGNHFLYATRQIVLLPSSETSKAPSCATVMPTGRPQTVPSSMTNPVRKSSYSPVGLPFFMKARTTL